ncbi:hypothetical protein HPB50_018556 [Hyalomma asiaticum]|uniref:Uncharacterized protein n=1 Tax=Hyalomma asiaticum TaxID=266040 RepID=A0ACB7TJQ0_HYAAI|nr:hypothetical protein HPB50_018556 [Hyalomma asiaticum]
MRRNAEKPTNVVGDERGGRARRSAFPRSHRVVRRTPCHGQSSSVCAGALIRKKEGCRKDLSRRCRRDPTKLLGGVPLVAKGARSYGVVPPAQGRGADASSQK